MKKKMYILVKELLEEKPARRDSDKLLTWAVLYKMGYADGYHIRFQDFLDKGFPAFESITRARRKVQENNPDLRASKRVQEMRKLKESKKGFFAFHEEVERKR